MEQEKLEREEAEKQVFRGLRNISLIAIGFGATLSVGIFAYTNHMINEEKMQQEKIIESIKRMGPTIDDCLVGLNSKYLNLPNDIYGAMEGINNPILPKKE